MIQKATSDITLTKIEAKEAICDCLYRYCRGIDRVDEDALRSAYWPDGTDHHGPYNGSASGFIEWALKVLPHFDRSIHQIHNILIEFKDDGAEVESYFAAYQRQPSAEGEMQQFDMKGRYLDWFTQRDGEWRILNRLVVFDWVEVMPLPSGSETERFGTKLPIGSNFPEGSLYNFFQKTILNRLENLCVAHGVAHDKFLKPCTTNGELF